MKRGPGDSWVDNRHGNDDCTPVPADKQGAARRLAPGLPDVKALAAGDVPATLKRC